MQSVLKLCVCVCVCMCRVVSYPRGFPVCHQVWNGRTACSSFLHTNDLFKNLTLSLSLSLPWEARLALPLFWEFYIATRGDKLFRWLKDHPVLENISRVGEFCVLYIFSRVWVSSDLQMLKNRLLFFFSELYRVRWMMYGKFSFFFKFCIRVQTKQKILKAETKIVSSGVDLYYTNTLIHARTLKINYL